MNHVALDAVARGQKLARTRTRLGSRSFFFASFALDPRRRTAAYALYSFLRSADDAADDPGTVEERRARVERMRASLHRVYAHSCESDLEHAFSWAVARFSIPKRPIESLLDAIETDLGSVRLKTWQSLHDYCYGVASTVGIAMAPVLGAPDRVLDSAASLGSAMQLTNILRDVREDLELDRIYLPREALDAYHVTESSLRMGESDDAWRSLAGDIATRAHRDYANAEVGIGAIGPKRSRLTVRLMRAIYREILIEIENRHFDVFAGRVVIGTPRKLWIATQILSGCDPARVRAA